MTEKFANRKVKQKNNRFTENLVLLLALISSIFLLSVSLVSGVVTIDSVTIPSSVNENEDIQMSFSASTDTNNSISYFIYRDNVLVSTLDEYSESTNYSSSGFYTYTFVASDIITNTTENHTLNIVDIPLTIISSSPTNKTYTNKTITINASLNLDANYCTYSTNNSLSGTIPGPDTYFYSQINFANDGSYIININCSNDYESKLRTVLFNIDTSFPVILSNEYDVNSDGTVTLSLTTDTVSLCKYDLSDKAFDSMIYTYSNSNNVQHYTVLSGLADGSHTYYIKCRDTNNNVGPAESLSFNIAISPTASITLSKSSPLKAGTYEVRLTSSETLTNAPSLYYTFNSDSTQRFVTLTGSGTNWEGYMIIDPATANVVGTFFFSGVDLNSNVGTVITSGQLFLVDTTAPAAPISVQADTQSNGYIKVKWYYDGEEAERYNIYRTTSGDPEYVDYLDSTTSKQYVDEEVYDGIVYYYRIAAIDAAGNDGYLSDVVEATAAARINSNYQNNDDYLDDDYESEVNSPTFLDSELIPKVDQLVTELNSYLADIDIVQNEISSIGDPTKLKIINLLKLSEKISTAKASIESAISDAENLKNEQLTVSQLDIKLSKLRMDSIKHKSSVVEDLIIDEQSSYEQITQSSDVDSAISEAVSVNLSKKVFDEYSQANKKLQDSVSVDTEIIMFKIKYLGKDDYEKHTLVRKSIVSSLELTGISLIEIIPKSFERDAKDISFDFEDQSNPIVVKSDPVLRWDHDTFNSGSIYYLINNHPEMSAAKDTKTIVLLKPDFKVSDTTSESEVKSENKLTGFVGLDLSGMELSPIHWMIIVGVGTIILLSSYYVSLEKKEKNALQPSNQKESSDKKGSSNRTSILGSVKSVLKDFNNARAVNAKVDGSNTGSKSSNVFLNFKPHSSNASTNDESNKHQTNHHNISTNNSSHSTHSHTTESHTPAKFTSKHTYDYMSKQLEVANILINSFEYEKCRTIYNHCVDFYKIHKFSSTKEKHNFKLMVDHLYMKLFAYRLVHISRKMSKSEVKKNVEALHKIHNKLNSSLDDVSEEYRDDEKKFIDYISHSKYHLHKESS